MTVGQVQRIRSRLRNRSGVFGAAGGGPSGNALLLESGDYLLLEDGNFLLLE